MNICVLNGSPKGKYSVTLQTCRYLEKKFPSHTFSYVNVGQKIKAFEKDMTEPLNAIAQADLIIFAYPVYTFIAPYQLHRFIELLKEQHLDFTHKCATQITTSKHFYDVTAHHYVRDNCFDMGLPYISGLSADMDDLTFAKGQQQAVDFFKLVEHSMAEHIYEPCPPASEVSVPNYTPSFSATEKSDAHPTVIITNMESDDVNLANKIADFQALYPYTTRVVNLLDFPFDGGCLGCFRCAVTGKCIYKDGFDTFLREEIQTAHAMIYAYSIKDHSMGASFKRFDDRQFCNGHRMVTIGTPIAHIVHGDYEHEHNLKIIVEGRNEVGRTYLSGVATDAHSMQLTVKRLCYALDNPTDLPQNFYGVGGTKIFRDLIYVMRGLMQADHKFYKEHGVYDDLPQRQKGRMIFMMILGALNKNPAVQKKMSAMMNKGIIAPYQKVIDKALPIS